MFILLKDHRVDRTRGSQEHVIAHMADSCQDKEHVKTFRSNILPTFGSNIEPPVPKRLNILMNLP